MQHDREDGEAIILDRVHGKSVEAIARERGLSVPAVERILDAEAERALGAHELRRMLFVEARRIEALKQLLWDKAMAGDNASAAVFAKLSERLASMIGLNAPSGHYVSISSTLEPAVERGTSTTRMLEAIKRLRGEEPEASASEASEAT